MNVLYMQGLIGSLVSLILCGLNGFQILLDLRRSFIGNLQKWFHRYAFAASVFTSAYHVLLSITVNESGDTFLLRVAMDVAYQCTNVILLSFLIFIIYRFHRITSFNYVVPAPTYTLGTGIVSTRSLESSTSLGSNISASKILVSDVNTVTNPSSMLDTCLESVGNTVSHCCCCACCGSDGTFNNFAGGSCLSEISARNFAIAVAFANIMVYVKVAL